MLFGRSVVNEDRSRYQRAVAGVALSPFGPCGEIVRMVSSGELELCLDARILSNTTKYCAVPNLYFKKTDIAALLEYITFRGHIGRIPAALPTTRQR